MRASLLFPILALAFSLIALSAVFWLVRLAVRYGTDDALRLQESRERAVPNPDERS